MQRARLYKTGPIVILVLGLLWFIPQVAAYILLHQDWVARRIEASLRESLGKTYDLDLHYRSLKAGSGLGLVLSDLTVRDLRRPDHPVFIHLDRAVIRVDLFRYLRDPRHIEAAVSQIVADNIEIRLFRTADGAWIHDRFRRTGGSTLYLRPAIILRRTRIISEAPLLANPIGRLTLGEARLDLNHYPELRLAASLKTDLDAGLSIKANGRYNLDKSSGSAEIDWQGASPARWQALGWVPADRIIFLQGQVDGQVQIEFGAVQGLRRGWAALRGGRIRLAAKDYPPIDVSGRATLHGRILDLKALRLGKGTASVSGQGRLDLTKKDPVLSGQVSFARVALGDLAAWVALPPGLGLSGAAAGTIAISGPLSRPDLNGRVSLRQGSLAYPAAPALSDCRLEGRLAGQTLIIDSVWAGLGGGSIQGRGRARLWPEARLECDLKASGLSLDRVLPETVAGEWTGRAGGQGHLIFAAQGWRGEADLSWDYLARRGREIPSGRVNLRGVKDASGLQLAADGSLGAGRFRLENRWAGDSVTGSGDLTDLPLRPFASFLPPDLGDLDGKMTASLIWRGNMPEPSVKISGQIEDPELAGRQADRLQANVSWNGSTLTIDNSEIKAGSATATLRGTLDLVKKTAALDLTAHRLPLSMIHQDLSGRIEGRLGLTGRWPELLTGRGWANAQDLSWRDLSLGSAETTLSLSGGKLILERGRLEAAKGRLDLSGTVALSGSHDLDLNISSLLWQLEALRPLLPDQPPLAGAVAGQVRISGPWLSPAASAAIRVGPGSFGDYAWQEAQANLRWKDQLRIEDGMVQLAGAEVSISGSLGPAGWNLDLDSGPVQLAALDDWLPSGLPWLAGKISGQARFEASVTGVWKRPYLDGRAAMHGLVMGGLSLDRLEGSFALDQGHLHVGELEAVRGDSRYTGKAEIDLKKDAITADLGVNRGDFRGLLELANIRTPWPVAGAITGHARANGPLRAPVVSAVFRLDQGRLSNVDLTGEADLQYAGDTLTLNRLRLGLEGGLLTASGHIAAEAFALQAEGKDLPLAALALLAGYPEQVKGLGQLNLTVNRTGGSMRGDFSLAAGPGSSWAQIPLDQVLIQGAIKDRNITSFAANLTSNGHSLTASGQFPLPTDLGPLEGLLRGLPAGQERLGLRIDAGQFPLPLLNPALKGRIDFSAGELNIAATVGGTWARPSLDGEARIKEASGRWPVLPDSLTAWNLDLRLSGQSLSLTKAEGKIGSGSAEAEGTIRLGEKGPEYDLRVKAKQIAYKNPIFDAHIAEADLRLQGGPLPRITGTGTLADTSVTVAPTVPGEPPPPLELDLKVTAGPDVRFFLPGVADIPVKGEARIRGTLAAPTLSGVLQADHGTIYVYGEKFDLTSAVGTFSEERGYLPYVELAGKKTVRGIKIYVNASGEIKEQGLLITFWSDPSLSQQEIIDILRLTSPIGADGSVPGSARLLIGGLELVVDTVFGRISEDMRRWLDADNLALRLDEQSGVISFEVGKYVLDSLYVSYELKLDDFSTKIWSFDLYLQPYLVLTGTFSTMGDPIWGFSYSYRF